MKKIGLLFISLFFITSMYAQQHKVKNLRFHDAKPIHWGFTFGVNTMDFTIHKNSIFYSDSCTIFGIENKKFPGFHLGPIVNIRLGRFFDLRFLVNLSFGQRNMIYYNYSGSVGDSASAYVEDPQKLSSTFIEFPLLLKFKGARLNNMRPYIISGVNPRYDLSARKALKENTVDELYLETFDAYFEFGFGFDWYLPYFKLSTEIKYSNGFMDVLKHNGSIYSIPVSKMTSKMLMLSFHFEG